MVESSRFITAADGTPIAYRQTGQGPPLVLANGLTTSDFFWRHVVRRWRQRRTVITWDYKGHGDSGPARDLGATTVMALVDDLQRVLDHLGVDQAPLVGFSMGCQIVLEAYRAMPERVRGVACLLGPAGRLFDTALPPITGRAVQILLRSMPDASTAAVMGGFGLALRIPLAQQLGKALGLIGRRAHRRDVDLYIRHFGSMHHPTVRAIALNAGDHDASDVLPRMQTPLLIVAGDKDPFAPAATVGEVMHARARQSELVRLEHGTHTSLFEHHDEIAPLVEDFLDRIPCE